MSDEDQGIACSFCGETDFDLVGLKTQGKPPILSDAQVPAADVLLFLRAKLAEAEQSAGARESMAQTHEIKLTSQQWKAAMTLHSSTRGLPMPSDEERVAAAARERRIADKYRHEATMYRAALGALAQQPSRDPQGCACSGCPAEFVGAADAIYCPRCEAEECQIGVARCRETEDARAPKSVARGAGANVR